MRFWAIVFFVISAAPAFAQQERECRGKFQFKIADGSYGCLLEVSAASLYRSNGTSQPAAQAIVAMFGQFDSSRRVFSKRHKAVCKAIFDEIHSRMQGQPYKKIALKLDWSDRDIKNDANKNKRRIQPILYRAALNPSCRTVEFY